ncbi:MAG TPA: hypothetical protein VGN94_14220 [Methylobacterium sp.]|nr:hypothetical protein [Methylobacterium sp.]
MGADLESSERATPAQDHGQGRTACAPAPEPTLIAVLAASEPLQLLPALRALGHEIQLFGPEEIGELAGWSVGLMVVDQDSLGGPEIVRGLRLLDGHARTPILLVASGEAGTIRREASVLGATEVLVRPLDILELQMRARALIELSLARRDAERVTRTMSRHVAAWWPNRRRASARSSSA